MNRAAMKALAKNMVDPRYQVRGLDSKAFPTCPFALRQTYMFCGNSRTVYSILGVMADIYIRATQKSYPKILVTWEESGELGKPDKLIVHNPEYAESMSMEAWRLDLPQEILDWYGLNRDEAAELWVQQSRGFSFEQLSKAILRGIEK